MKRSSSLKRTPIRPGTKPIKQHRVSKRFAKRRDPEYCAWIRTLPCVLHMVEPWYEMRAECCGAVECAHVTSRGAGGIDRGNTLPLCVRHHRRQHLVGVVTFQREYNVDLRKKAAALLAEYERRGFA